MEMEEEGDTTMIKDIAAQFVVDITGVLAKIDAAVAAGDFKQVAAGAHTIKGSSATFGLFEVEKIAREVEACAKDPARNASVAALCEPLKEAFAKGRAALEAYLAEK